MAHLSRDLSQMSDAELSTIEIDLDIKNFQSALDNVKGMVDKKDEIGGSDKILWNQEANSFISSQLPEYCKHKGLPEKIFRDILTTVNAALTPKKSTGCLPPSKSVREKRVSAAIATAKAALQSRFNTELIKYGLFARIEGEGMIITAIILEDVPLSMQRFSDINLEEHIQTQLRYIEQKHLSDVRVNV
jgi:hypothetical protein